MARLYKMLLFLLNLFLQAFGQQGNDLVAVAYDAEVGNAENGGEFVLVNGDDEVGFLHAGKVLDGSGNTDGEVYYCITRSKYEIMDQIFKLLFLSNNLDISFFRSCSR